MFISFDKLVALAGIEKLLVNSSPYNHKHDVLIPMVRSLFGGKRKT